MQNKVIFCITLDSITNQDNSKYWTKLAYHRDTLVGALFCKIEIYNTNETLTESQTTQNIYAANVHTLACLPTYRRRGIGSILLNKLIDFCKFHNKVILEVFSHIQQSTDGPKGIFKVLILFKKFLWVIIKFAFRKYIFIVRLITMTLYNFIKNLNLRLQVKSRVIIGVWNHLMLIVWNLIFRKI